MLKRKVIYLIIIFRNSVQWQITIALFQKGFCTGDVSLAKIVFTTDDIANVIKNLDSNKSHSHDNISIRMLNIWGVSSCKPPEIIFRTCLNHGKFPEEWKKANVVPVFKKGDKQCVKNYRPVSLLPICSKIFERIIYNNTYNYLIDNNLISQNQSGFKRGDLH